MKKKNKKEIVILSLIFIAIIACIVLLIVLKNKKTNKDEFYLSQNPIMYIRKTKEKRSTFESANSIEEWYSIYKDGTVYTTIFRGTSGSIFYVFHQSAFVKKLSRSELKNLQSELTDLSNSQHSSTKSPSYDDLSKNHYYEFEVNGTRYYAKNYNVYLNILSKYVNISDYIKNNM